MASSRHVDALVHRLETAIAQEIHGRGRVALAYSGGLASTLIAMIARKRCELDCVVAALRRAGVVWPLRTIAPAMLLSRPTLRAAATILGLPSEWARVSHRPPVDGAGIRDWLRESREDRD